MGEITMKKEERQSVARKMLIRVGVLLSIIAGFAHAQVGVNYSNATVKASGLQANSRPAPLKNGAPLTADSIMEKLLQITASPEGVVRKSSVEKIFQTKLLNKRNVTEFGLATKEALGTWYFVRPNQDWQFNLGVAEYSNGDSWFGFSFASELEGPEFGFEFTKEIPQMCVEDLKLTEAIERQGWKLNRRTQLLGEHGLWLGQVVYQKGNLGYLRLLFSPQQTPISPQASTAHCLERLAIDSSAKWERGVIESIAGYRDLPKQADSRLHQSN